MQRGRERDQQAGPSKPGLAGATGGPSASARKLRCQGGTLHGPDLKADVILRWIKGGVMRSGPVRKNGPARIQHRGGAPRASGHVTGRNAHLRTVSTRQGAPLRRSAPSPLWEKGKRNQRCAPASRLRGGGALAFYPSPLGDGA